MVAKAENSGDDGEVVAAAAAVVAASNHQSRRKTSFNKPSWLLCTIADLDERMNILTRKVPKEANTSDSFAARANSYYHERPQLLALLHDLYNGYLSLADRYCQALSKNNLHHRASRCSSPILDEANEGDTGEVIDSDAESSLSFQLPTVPQEKYPEVDADMVVAELVMKTVEFDIVLNELGTVEKSSVETSRKTDLQKNLLDVLESERLILVTDNATLGYRVEALVEENNGLASESVFLKRKVTELARCVLKTREDHRVCVLSRKIEDLQAQIHGLEKRNKEYYQRLMKQEDNGRKKTKKKGNDTMKKCKGGSGGEEVNLDECFRAHDGVVGLKKCFSFDLKNGDRDGEDEVEGGSRRVGSTTSSLSSSSSFSSNSYKLWDKMKKLDMFLCGPNFGGVV